MKRIAIVGARGYVGAELLRLLAAHGGFELVLVGSRQLAAERVCDHFDHPSELEMSSVTPDDVPDVDADAWVLALPNGHAPQWAAAIDAHDPRAVIVDLSSDFRFDDGWTYGLTEVHRDQLRAATRISNPGCYATGAQMALRPVLDLVDGRPTVFGISGYSGAGTTPSERNDPDVLHGNVLPYKLVAHTHEHEITRQLGRSVSFMPHVAEFFRGITLTITADTKPGVGVEQLTDAYGCWDDEPLVLFTAETPKVRNNVGEHFVRVGGLVHDEPTGRMAVVATLDNLLKGAATQALQNLNLACGFDELRGIR